MTLLAIAATLTASAQSFTLTSNGTEVKDGDRINLVNTWEETALGTYEASPKLMFKATSTGTAYSYVKYTKNNSKVIATGETPLLSVNTCAFGQCTSANFGSQEITKSQFVTAGQTVDLKTEFVLDCGDDEIEPSQVNFDSEFYIECELNGQTLKLYCYVDSSTGAVGGIGIDESAPVTYYDLQGRAVANPDKGVYIKRQGSKVTKVML